MNKDSMITILGGDKRYMFLSCLFSENGYNCKHTHGRKLSDINGCNILILPIPSFDSDGNITGADYTVYDLFNSCKNTLIFAAKVPTVIKKLAMEYKITLYDYLDSEEFNILNAIPSAEGAILTFFEKTNMIVQGQSFTVLGYGRIGKALSLRLKALGGNVTVGARSKAARLNAANDTLLALPIRDAIKKSENACAVFNTIPSPILSDEDIRNMRASLIIDLASIPGGLTEKAKAEAGESFIHALSLPGRHFPYTAGEIIYKTILGILDGEENAL